MEFFIPIEPLNFAWIWFGLAIVFVIIEFLTAALTTVWFAAGALILVFVSFLPIPFLVQVIIFLTISSVLLILTRPLLLKKMKIKKEATNVDRFVNMHAVVTKTIKPFEKGEIKAEGTFWMAKTEDKTTLEKGASCSIVRIEGATAIVRCL